MSPDRKKHRDNLTPSSLADGSVLSPESSLPSGALSPEMEVEPQSKPLSSSSHHKHHHKKRSKTKRSRRRARGSNEEMEVDLVGDYPGDRNLDEGNSRPRPDNAANQDGPAESVKEEATLDLQIVDIRGDVELSENEGAESDSRGDKGIAEGGGVSTAVITDSSSRSIALVPYQDSSNTETEGREKEETHEASNSSGQERPAEAASHLGAKKQPSGSSSSSIVGDQEVNEAIEQLEAAMKEGAAGSESAEKSNGGGDETISEGAPPPPTAEEEGGETMEDSLMIDVHVDEDAIDPVPPELLDAECPNRTKTGIIILL